MKKFIVSCITALIFILAVPQAFASMNPGYTTAEMGAYMGTRIDMARPDAIVGAESLTDHNAITLMTTTETMENKTGLFRISGNYRLICWSVPIDTQRVPGNVFVMAA